jgi:D-galactose 1-dehydrogenase
MDDFPNPKVTRRRARSRRLRIVSGFDIWDRGAPPSNETRWIWSTGMTQYRIAIIGLGKIAQDQHVPVIGNSPDFELAAVASQRGLEAAGVRSFRDHQELFANTSDLDAVAICTPPQPRYAIAREALAAGLHVVLEKPPTATLSELADLQALAQARGLVLMTTWHSQYNSGVDEAKRRLLGKTVTRLFVNWKEDVRKWHPGQKWIWQAGGFGVFDPGINALSIVTKIMPDPVFVTAAELLFPAGADAPIAAFLGFSCGGRSRGFSAEFDWRPIQQEVWEISVETEDGLAIHLAGGGARLEVDGKVLLEETPREYEAIYAHFSQLLASGTSHVDPQPFRLVADAFLIGRRQEVEAFRA